MMRDGNLKLKWGLGWQIIWFILSMPHTTPKSSELLINCLQYCDFAKKDRAHLIDRVLLHEGKEQLYGTQFQRDAENNRMTSRPIVDKKNVDARRKKMGLRPLKYDLVAMNKKFYNK